MKTTFYVYKFGNAYVKISKNTKSTGGTFITTLVKDIDKAAYWGNKRDAKSWKFYVDKKYPNAKLVPCGLCETNKK